MGASTLAALPMRARNVLVMPLKVVPCRLLYRKVIVLAVPGAFAPLTPIIQSTGPAPSFTPRAGTVTLIQIVETKLEKVLPGVTPSPMEESEGLSSATAISAGTTPGLMLLVKLSDSPTF